MVILYLLLSIIAVGVLLLSDTGKSILRGAGLLIGGIFVIILIGIIALCLYFFINWLGNEGDYQDIVGTLILLALILGITIHNVQKMKDAGHWNLSYVKREVLSMLKIAKVAFLKIVHVLLICVAVLLFLLAAGTLFNGS